MDRGDNLLELVEAEGPATISERHPFEADEVDMAMLAAILEEGDTKMLRGSSRQ
jgi:hypothetical protein